MTIWTPPERLRQQLIDSEIKPNTKLGIFRGKSRVLKIQRDYENVARICSHYRQWFDYTRTKSDDHVVVDLSGPVRLYTLEEWEQLARQLEG